MLVRNLTADHVYLACGRTDMRKSIDGLAALVLSKFQLDPHQPVLFLCCGRRKDRIKGLLWDETGFLLLYKRLENGQYQWPDTPKDLLEISKQQLRWLTEGLSISQPKAVQKVTPAYSFLFQTVHNACKSVDSSARVNTEFAGFLWYNGQRKLGGFFMTDIREQEMQNRIDSLTLEKENLRYEIDCLKEQIAQLKKMAFGSRTEKTKRILGDVEEINIFDEAEIEAKGSAPEPIIEVPAHKRHKKQKGHLEQILKNVPYEECVITLPEDERICKRCGTPLTLNEKGRKNKTKSYMWVYTNGEFVRDGRQIRIYEYHPGRNGGFA